MKRIFVIISIFALMFVLNGCTTTQSETSSNISSSDSLSNELVEIDEPLFLIEESDKNVISVQVPVLITENDDKVNQVIHDYVENKIADICLSEYNIVESSSDVSDKNAEYSQCYIDVKYRVSLNTENLVSIVFDGIYNYRSAAHPTNLFFTLNINPKTAETVEFTDTYVLDDAVYELFTESALDNISKLTEDITVDSLCTKDEFIDGIKSQNEFYCYYTETSIGISCPVPHVLGDHLEVEIPLTKLIKSA